MPKKEEKGIFMSEGDVDQFAFEKSATVDFLGLQQAGPGLVSSEVLKKKLKNFEVAR